MGFDWTKIEGYSEELTAEEKVALLEKIDMGILSDKVIDKVKYDKVSSELADVKRQLKARMTEDEQKEADRKATEEAMKTELETLRKERALNKHKATFLEQNYDADSAQKLATALVDGDTEGFFASLKNANAALEQKLRADLLKDTPRPPAGGEKNPSVSETMAKEIGGQAAAANTLSKDILSKYK